MLLGRDGQLHVLTGILIAVLVGISYSGIPIDAQLEAQTVSARLTASALLKLNLGHPIRAIAWSPDGAKLAVGIWWGVSEGDRWVEHGRVIVLSSNGSRLWESRDIGGIASLSWSPDGQKLAVGVVGYRNMSVIVLTTNGTMLWRRVLGDVLPPVVDWSPNGDRIAVCAGYVTVLNSSGGKLWSRKDIGCTTVSWSPDGTKLAVGGYNGELTVLDYVGGILWRFEDSSYSVGGSGYSLSGPIYDFSWSPLGNEIAAGIGGALALFAVLEEGLEIVWANFLPGIGAIYSISWSPDGSKIAVGGEWGLIVLAGSSFWKVGSLRGPIYVAWSPDGNKLAIGSDSGDLIVYEFASPHASIGYPPYNTTLSPTKPVTVTTTYTVTRTVWANRTYTVTRTVTVAPAAATATMTVTRTVYSPVTVTRTFTKTLTVTGNLTSRLVKTKTLYMTTTIYTTKLNNVTVTKTLTETVYSTTTRKLVSTITATRVYTSTTEIPSKPSPIAISIALLVLTVAAANLILLRKK